MEIIVEGFVLASLALVALIWGIKSVSLKEIKYGQPMKFLTKEPTRESSVLLEELKESYARYNNRRAEKRSTVKIVIPSAFAVFFVGLIAAVACYFMVKYFHQHGLAQFIIRAENYDQSELDWGMNAAAGLIFIMAAAYGALVGKIALMAVRYQARKAAEARMEKGCTVVIRQSASVVYIVRHTCWAFFIEIPAQIIHSVASKFKRGAKRRQSASTTAVKAA